MDAGGSSSHVSTQRYRRLTPDEMEGVYVLLSEALSDLAADVPCSAADCIKRAMRRLGIG